MYIRSCNHELYKLYNEEGSDKNTVNQIGIVKLITME